MRHRNHQTSHVLFVFLDGVGLGTPDSSINPFARDKFFAFEALAGRQPWTIDLHPKNTLQRVVRPIDATLSVDGLPQSGTGQATLLTGINCAQLAGRHFGPYPHSKTKPAIAEKNVFSQINPFLSGYEEPAAFANAYPERFFTSADTRNRWTVTTLSCIEAGVPVRTHQHLEQGLAIAADLTGSGWISHLGYTFEPIDEAQAARRLAAISGIHPFTLFEYYFTDKAGHSQSFESSHETLSSLDAFFGALIEQLDFQSTTLIVTSDHGNIEDLSTKSHTFNPVPFIAMGNQAGVFSHVESLVDVTPAIVEAFKTQRETST